jgi:hypothetical protein
MASCHSVAFPNTTPPSYLSTLMYMIIVYFDFVTVCVCPCQPDTTSIHELLPLVEHEMYFVQYLKESTFFFA